jgi:hypothetical protein
VSSANIFILFKTSFSMSLMNNRNKKGPRVDPWGTPALTSRKVSINIYSLFSIIKETFNPFQNIIFPQIPYFRSLKIKPECQTRSNALEMSQNINRTSLPRSIFFIIVHVLYMINNWLHVCTCISIIIIYFFPGFSYPS